MTPLPPKKRSELRAQAHKLTPVVIIGDKGLTDEVVAEIDRSLKAHELIKVRAFTDDRKARGEWLEAICGRLEAHPVQRIGKVFVLYRENPPEPKERRERKPAAKSPAAGLDSRLRGNDRKVRGDDRKVRGNDKQVRGNDRKARRDDVKVKGTSRPRSRTPSPRPASEPRRRRPRTSR
jgi:putative YhbY family RNA-binding protein